MLPQLPEPATEQPALWRLLDASNSDNSNCDVAAAIAAMVALAERLDATPPHQRPMVYAGLGVYGSWHCANVAGEEAAAFLNAVRHWLVPRVQLVAVPLRAAEAAPPAAAAAALAAGVAVAVECSAVVGSCRGEEADVCAMRARLLARLRGLRHHLGGNVLVRVVSGVVHPGSGSGALDRDAFRRDIGVGIRVDVLFVQDPMCAVRDGSDSGEGDDGASLLSIAACAANDGRPSHVEQGAVSYTHLTLPTNREV